LAPYLLFCQIAGWILGPDVIKDCLRSHSQVSIAEINIFTSSTTPFEKPLPIFEPMHKWIRYIHPDVTKVSPLNISEGMRSPELIWINISQLIHCSYADARLVTSLLSEKG
jgi:hypothetical protein